MKNQFAAPILINGVGGSILERLPLDATGESKYDESWLQKLLYIHPEALPVSEIDQSYLNLVPICREMNTPAGPVDVLYATPNGKLLILQDELWRQEGDQDAIPPLRTKGMWSDHFIHRSPGHNLCCDRLLALSPKHHASPDHQCPSGRYPASIRPVWPIWKKSACLQNRRIAG